MHRPAVIDLNNQPLAAEDVDLILSSLFGACNARYHHHNSGALRHHFGLRHAVTRVLALAAYAINSQNIALSR